MSRANTQQVEQLHGNLIEYCNIWLEAVLDGAELPDERMIAVIVNLTRNEKVTAERDTSADVAFTDTLADMRSKWGNKNGE
jgi:hypothetical protein